MLCWCVCLFHINLRDFSVLQCSWSLFFALFGNSPSFVFWLAFYSRSPQNRIFFPKVLCNYGGHVLYCSKSAVSMWDFKLGAGNVKKQGRMRIYSGNVAAQVVSQAAHNVLHWDSSAAVSLAARISEMSLLVIFGCLAPIYSFLNIIIINFRFIMVFAYSKNQIYCLMTFDKCI